MLIGFFAKDDDEPDPDDFPPVDACVAIALVEAALCFAGAYALDRVAVRTLPAKRPPGIGALDARVAAERERALELPYRVGVRDEGLKMLELRKIFPPKRPGAPPTVAVENLTVEVARGEVFGLLGANGAGKTTAMSMVMRAIDVGAGDAVLNGYSVLPHDDFVRGAGFLGVVNQHNTLWDLMNAEEHLALFARLRGVREDAIAPMVAAMLDQTELRPHRHKLTTYLSGGMKRKLCLAIALVGDPKLVMLDEPSAGLDPVSTRTLWNLILRTMTGRAVVLTSHNMAEVETLCTKIGIMTHGQLRVFGTAQQLKEQLCDGFELTVTLRDGADKTAAAAQIALAFPAARLAASHASQLVYALPGDVVLGDAYAELARLKDALGADAYSIARPTMEQVFMKTVTELEDVVPDDSAGVGNALLTAGATGAIADDELDLYQFREKTCCCASEFAHKLLAKTSCGCCIIQCCCGWWCLPFPWQCFFTCMALYFQTIFSCIGMCCVRVLYRQERET